METETFGRASAAAIALAGGNLPISTLFQLQESCLNVAPSTKVKTANGVIDMRHPKSNPLVSSHRLYNNRLTTMSGCAANHAASTISNRPNMVSIPDMATARDIIELSSSSSSSLEGIEEDTRKHHALDDTQFAASQMHERILARGRVQLTSLVKNRNRTDKENSTKEKLKATVETLQREKDSGEHIATIFNVTSNGIDLFDSPVIDSQNCLDLVMDLFD